MPRYERCSRGGEEGTSPRAGRHQARGLVAAMADRPARLARGRGARTAPATHRGSGTTGRLGDGVRRRLAGRGFGQRSGRGRVGRRRLGRGVARGRRLLGARASAPGSSASERCPALSPRFFESRAEQRPVDAALADRAARHEVARRERDRGDDEGDRRGGGNHAERDPPPRGAPRGARAWAGGRRARGRARRPPAVRRLRVTRPPRAVRPRCAAAAARPPVPARPRVASAPAPSAGRSVVHARAIRSVGRCIASLISATRTGVSAAAIHVPAIQSCEVTAAAEADATLAIVSVRMFRRRSSSRSAERAGGRHANGAG